MRHTLFLFGEAERGDFCRPLVCKSLEHMLDAFGNPPDESCGIFYGIQALLYDRKLIFYRVHEEGFSREDYLHGLGKLKKREIEPPLSALCMPGVGYHEIISLTGPICEDYNSCLILSQQDLYDYLTVK